LSELYPDVDGSIKEDFFSYRAWNNLGVPAQPLTQYHVYEVSSQPNNWAAWINGVLQFQTTNNTVTYNEEPMLGQSQSRYFAGDIAEVMIFDRALVEDEQIAVGSYLISKYNLSQYATNAFPPTTPTNLIGIGISPYQLNLEWVRTSTNETAFDIERKLGSGGTYQEIGTSMPGVTNFVDITASPTNQNFYRVKARNYFGDSAYSPAISPPSVSITNWPSAILENETNLIIAQAADADGTVSNVQFFASFSINNPFIGIATTSPYTVNWMPTMEGDQSLTALATDNQGNSQYSAPVTVTVYLDSNGDGIPDYLQVKQGNDPINPWIPPAFNPSDTNAPIITLLIPTNAIVVH